MATSDLKVDWTKPTAGPAVASYTVQGKVETGGTYVDLATGVAPVGTDPQTTTIAKADLDTKLNNPTTGANIIVSVIAVGSAGSKSDPSPETTIAVP